ncbi:hypothetical protein A2U01_0076053, partial [Trifolium medium]|nr:hypothetical protein [Trifolium medium]
SRGGGTCVAHVTRPCRSHGGGTCGGGARDEVEPSLREWIELVIGLS